MAELDLFGASPDRKRGFLTISELNRRARGLVEGGFDRLWVRGEVSGFKSYRSGHWYFSLRDRSAQVRCVMWRSDNETVAESLVEGDEVFVEVQPTLWEERGEFRLTVRRVLSTATAGEWQVRLEKARRALERDGLFEPGRKKALPEYPRKIVVVTSGDGAAIRDIVTVLRRRWTAEIFLVPTLVQGEAAAGEICRALAVADRVPGADVVIVGRGGGSREDLWAFNTEPVARAVAAMNTPCISAVGHETDVTLTDLVADLRAPTPSAAAEAAVPDRNIVANRTEDLGRRLAGGLNRWLTWGHERIDRTSDSLQAGMSAFLAHQKRRVGELGATLDAISPLKVLERGYAVPRDESGKVLRRVADFPPGVVFGLTVADGTVRAQTVDDA